MQDSNEQNTVENPHRRADRIIWAVTIAITLPLAVYDMGFRDSDRNESPPPVTTTVPIPNVSIEQVSE